MITYDSIAAMKMNRTLFDLNNKLNSVNSALKTGSTVNKPSDNPAVFNLTQRTKDYAALYSALNQNAQTGISIIDTDLQSISKMQNKLDEIKTLLTTATSEGLTPSQRDEIQTQINTLMSEITDIRDNTEFNGLKLFEMKGQYEVTPPYHQLTIDDFDNVQTITLRGTEIQSGEIDGTTYYLVENVDQLRLACGGQNGENFVLLSDIDLNGVTWANYTNNATIDGNGHVVKNYSSSSYALGLIYQNYGTIKNLGMENCSATGNCSAILCNDNRNTISDCYVTDSTVSGIFSAILCYGNNGTLSDCYVTNSTVSDNDSAILCNYNTSTISDCYALNINANSSMNSIYYNSSSVNNCYQNHNESDTTATYKDTEWFATDAAVTALGSDYELLEGKDHPTLKSNPEPSLPVPIDNSIRIQIGKEQDAYVKIDTTFYFDDNFSFDASSQANAAESLTKLTTLKNQLSEKTEALNTSRKELVKKANYSESKVTAANNIISAWTGFDQDEMLEKKAKIISDITNIHSLQEQLSSMNLQMCRSFILGAIINNYNSGSSSLFSPLYSNSFLSNLLST